VLKFLWYCVFGVVSSLTVLIGLHLPGAYTEAFFWLPFILAAAALGGALFVINDRKLGTVSFRRLWEVLRAMPRTLQVGLLLAFPAAFLYQANVEDELGFKQTYATIGVWFCTLGTGLAYGDLARRRGGEPPDDEQRRIGRMVIGIVWGVVLLGALRAAMLNWWIPSGQG